MDPLAMKYAYNSPYSFSENRVIDCIELEGGEKLEVISKTADQNLSVIKTIDGLDVMKQMLYDSSEKFGNLLINKSYSMALRQMADGFMVGNNDKIYQTTALLKNKTVNLIDGKKLEEVTLGRNFGFKNNSTGEVVTTKGINQVEALSNKGASSIFRGVGNLFKAMPLLSCLFDLTAGTVQQDDPKYVNALALSPVGSFSQEQFETDNVNFNNSLYSEFNEAKSAGLEKTKDFINKYSQDYTKNFQVLYINDDSANKLIKGEYNDYIELFDDAANSKTKPENAVIIEYHDDKAIIHTIFLNIPKK